MDQKYLRPIKEALETSGRLSYGESVRAWNTIRFKKEVINEFRTLKERQSRFGYKAILYPSFEDLEKALRKMKKNKDPVPIILSFWKVS